MACNTLHYNNRKAQRPNKTVNSRLAIHLFVNRMEEIAVDNSLRNNHNKVPGYNNKAFHRNKLKCCFLEYIYNVNHKNKRNCGRKYFYSCNGSYLNIHNLSTGFHSTGCYGIRLSCCKQHYYYYSAMEQTYRYSNCAQAQSLRFGPSEASDEKCYYPAAALDGCCNFCCRYRCLLRNFSTAN